MDQVFVQKTQGNSTCGNRGGMMHEGSGLIRDVVRIVNTSMPKILFLENVPQVLGNGSVDYILRELRMYDVAWAVLKACDVGRPHVRKRFFAVAVLRCAEARHVLGNAVAVSKAHDLRSPDHEPRRMLDVNTTANVRRWKAMGNSVVPACSKRAFEVLGDIHLDPCRLSLPVLPGTKLPLCGYFNGRMYENEVPTVKQTYANVTFDSQLYKPPSGHRPHPTHNADILFEGVRSVPFWSTPRTCSNMSHLLTRRSMGDLGTQLRFERETPDDDRRGTASAEFAEWLMVNPPASWPLSPVLPTVP